MKQKASIALQQARYDSPTPASHPCQFLSQSNSIKAPNAEKKAKEKNRSIKAKNLGTTLYIQARTLASGIARPAMISV
ncbi:hypothetical protein LTR96_010999 [Exophiala xenobiotica]|nr:hypothetical protein LTR41_011118 [Exophiala xenobiotica]KAK5215905.1 hypothetical protein LTR72_011077 [Exophiala xenobiotica]KAK5220336.1 hypothetical protein LTR47_011233 [Exophiala xenobiotica]KAK5245923.1 hypothetical protein LTS06_008705 [Exophiala xenobiotica]KAK5261501.1 hypothetical protein LTR40_002087 [Exophiala xenobiotica]